jgi:oligoendopeptidase F
MSLTTPTSDLALTWDLSDLFSGPDDPRIAEALDRATRDAEAYATRFRGTIDVPGGPAPAHLLDALTSLERVIEGVERVDAYSHMIFSADTTKEAHRDLEQKVRVQSTAIQNLLVFFELEWQKVEDADAERIIAAPELARYAYYLRRERQNRPHTLSEPEEKIMTEMRVTGAYAWRGLFTELIAGLKFPMERDGVTKDFTLAELMALVRDPDRSVRQRAYETQYRVLRQHDQTLTYVYNTLVQEKRIVDRLRVFPDPMASRHLSNDLDPAIVETMLTAVEANAGTAQEYFRLKAKLLKLPKLAIYDQYAPIGGDAETCDYPTARRSILDAFTAFTPRFGDLARKFFDKRWIDAEVRPGKIGGAYCMSITPRQHPYILCNYTGNLRDVLTVAHELGHGLHGMLARGQSDFEYHSSLALAETASVFGEILVFERLVDAASTPQAKIGLIGGKIEDIFATVFRQTTLTRFEQFAFDRQQKSRLTPEGLGEDWIEANRRYYGDSVEMDENYRWGWSYIPHFINSPFYCYAYSFGEMLVLALYRTYQEQGESFIPRYVELLSRGGSGSPAELLAPLGVDIADPAFWSKGFVEIDRLIAKMRELVDAVAAA